MEIRAAPKLDRLDRYVRRSYLKMGDGTSRHRVSYSLEEALRLANLPGEEEGRIYCFRRVTFDGIPAEANRRAWVEGVQQVLARLAAEAVHAGAPGAEGANAVYFHHQEEALEFLLRHSLRQGSRPQWFSASVLGLPPEAGSPIVMQAILQRLRPPAVHAGAAAAIILAAIGPSDPAPLLAAVPTAMARAWLDELDGSRNPAAAPAHIPLPRQVRRTLEQAASQFGWRDPRTTWLAALVVMALSPSTLASAGAVRIARATLRILETEHAPARRVEAAPMRAHAAPPAARPLIFDEDDECEPSRLPAAASPRLPSAGIVAGSSPSPPSDTLPPLATSAISPPAAIPAEGKSGAVSPAESAPPRVNEENEAPLSPANAADEVVSALPDAVVSALPPSPIAPSQALLGEPTSAAGLYFLLNALRRLGIAAALESCPALREADFVAHLLRRIAENAGVAPGDAILLCIRTEPAEFRLPPESLSIAVWPANLSPPGHSNFDGEYLLRAWALAVRRWCWRTGRTTVREILHRPGLVWLTRSDLDVTMPLGQIDIRIRRIGLDIDPGWVPWFCRFGKVVRFHYRSHNREGPC